MTHLQYPISIETLEPPLNGRDISRLSKLTRLVNPKRNIENPSQYFTEVAANPHQQLIVAKRIGWVVAKSIVTTRSLSTGRASIIDELDVYPNVEDRDYVGRLLRGYIFKFADENDLQLQLPPKVVHNVTPFFFDERAGFRPVGEMRVRDPRNA